jgi:hypothetical protein
VRGVLGDGDGADDGDDNGMVRACGECMEAVSLGAYTHTRIHAYTHTLIHSCTHKRINTL